MSSSIEDPPTGPSAASPTDDVAPAHALNLDTGFEEPIAALPHVGEHDVPPPHELNAVDRFDQAVDKAFDVLRGTEPADRIFYAVSELADFSLLWLLIAASKAAISDKNLPNAVRVGAVLSVETVLVNGVIKSAFKRERPVVEAERPYHLRVPLTTSFPSGHSSAAMVAVLLLSENSKVKPLWWGLAGLVASSRVYVRIHHASDVVGGLAVGLAFGSLAKKAWPLDKGLLGTRHLRRRNAR
jgi:undecaprenyl-diphosphatase